MGLGEGVHTYGLTKGKRPISNYFLEAYMITSPPLQQGICSHLFLSVPLVRKWHQKATCQSFHCLMPVTFGTPQCFRVKSHALSQHYKQIKRE